MPYAQSEPVVTPSTRLYGGRRSWHVRFTESAVAAGSTWTVTGMPETGTITQLRVCPTFVTAGSVQPAVGRTVGWTLGNANADHVAQVSAAAASINDTSGIRYNGLTAGTLFGRSIPNAGSDTTTVVEITIVDGHF